MPKRKKDGGTDQHGNRPSDYTKVHKGALRCVLESLERERERRAVAVPQKLASEMTREEFKAAIGLGPDTTRTPEPAKTTPALDALKKKPSKQEAVILSIISNKGGLLAKEIGIRCEKKLGKVLSEGSVRSRILNLRKKGYKLSNPEGQKGYWLET